jgi:uncharacterized protein (TIGR00299 family) protein
MKVLYYDCFSGISGDMNLGALLDLGVDKDYLLEQLALLQLKDEYEISVQTARKKGITGTRVVIKLLEGKKGFAQGPHSDDKKAKPGFEKGSGRTLDDIEQIIKASSLAEGVKTRSMAIFKSLAQAEAQVHGIPKERVHFHEVGAIDALLDIVGAAVCLEYLQVDQILASSVELGGGFVRCQHGLLPVPVPAVVELLRGVPVKTGRVKFETTTPTGAAILATTVTKYTDRVDFLIEKIGYGLGERDLEIPNVLRVYLGELPVPQSSCSKETYLSEKGRQSEKEAERKAEADETEFSGGQKENEIQLMLETNIDDMNPEIYGYVEERLFVAGALDVYKTPIIMKKGRPAVKLSVLAPEEKHNVLKEIIFRETSAIGLRSYPVAKSMLERKLVKIATKYGEIRVKFAYLRGRLLKYKAEYEDCRKLAAEKEIPLRAIYSEIELEINKTEVQGN